MEMDQSDLAFKFLLGKLSEEEQAKVEREYFHSTSSFEEILVAETALTDAYVTQRLSPDDTQLFEKRLLVNSKQRQRAAFAATFVNYVSRLPAEDIGVSPLESKWHSAISRYFFLKPLLSYSLTAATILIVAGAAFWIASDRSQQAANDDLAKAVMPAHVENDTPAKTASTNQSTDPNDTNEKPLSITETPNAVGKSGTVKEPLYRSRPSISQRVITTIILPLISTRDAGAGNVFVIPKNTVSVNLQLTVEDERFPNYFAVVETVDGQQVWRGKVAGSAVKDAGSRKVAFTVPARRLERGDYILTLKGSANGRSFQTIGDYSFTVDRR